MAGTTEHIADGRLRYERFAWGSRQRTFKVGEENFTSVSQGIKELGGTHSIAGS
jgi:hypothetical protein